MTSISHSHNPSTSTSNSSSRPNNSRITTWPLEFDDPEPSSSSSRPIHTHLTIPSLTTSTSTSSKSLSTSRGTKRSNASASGTISPRRIKRVRGGTPLEDDSTPNIEDGDGGTSSFRFMADASGLTTAVAGPSSYEEEREGDVEVGRTSENGDGEEDSKSVLFSERTGKTELLEEGAGDETILALQEDAEGLLNGNEFLVEDDPQEEGGEEFLVEQQDEDEEQYEPQDTPEEEEVSTNPRPLTIDLREVMPPPPSVKSRSTSSGHPDTMTQVIEGSSKTRPRGHNHSFIDLNEQAYSDNIDDQDVKEGSGSPESYHSGDSDEYEMDHRPVLERTAIKRDIRSFTESLTVLREGVDGYLPFKVVDRLGEGTFSSVYLAYDCLNRTYANEYWSGIPDEDQEEDEEQQPPVKVALKKILVTSSPARIENELAILEALRGCRNVSQLISAFREEDQIIIVLPYHQSDDFRHFYRHMDPPHIRSYLQSLFRALKDIHKRGIVHRDVKPANFLYDYESGEGVLVDFGLAERYVPPRKPTCQHAPATVTSLQGSKIKTGETPIVEQAVYDARKRGRQGEGRIGFPHEDKRPTIKTNRAGTRGFRAPEVLLKCPDQTVAIDIWSAGVMLLSILTHKFPVFNSSDDIEALMEIAAIFGRAAMERCALLHNRTIISNVPTLDSHPSSLASLVMKLNPHIYTPHMTNPTPDDAREHIEAIDQAIDLCQKLLRLDSTKRLSAAQALRHPFLAPREDEEDVEEGRDEVLDPKDGKCGELHEVEDGRHRAYFHPDMRELPFGQGIPPSRDSLCPEHEHYQERFQINPLVTRRWVIQAAEEIDPETQEDQDEEAEGFVIEPTNSNQHNTSNGNTKYVNPTSNGVPLKERDVNAPSNQVSNGMYERKRRGALVEY
ncbi:hypothetical protein I302_102858 [Kwoniella bestiolae CBS 10118]|uniref:non-specific serine/threonine protein kinase n=1 Tax=Kwoniella bestiolae CBS 10118 TaxID=1296100 RepID=A0A1B9GGF4_9TREE|nr:CDC7 protein kinase [Kwoniella bestiolae CBS 10118]OCF30035.1 CDC7 protein kinase [Kwoniella bestiolae CBS 10118]